MNPEEEIPPNHKLANPSCKHCCGTGVCWFVHDKETNMSRSIVCRCVDRARFRRAPWLQRHGINRQPWIKDVS
jgi:hypothetical protein